jgi:hypothetical protein
LRHYVKAIAIVRQFLATHSPLVTPEAASSAQAFLGAAEPPTHRSRSSRARRTQKYLDDEYLGPAPLASELHIDVGVHRIIVKRRGLEPYSATLTFPSAQSSLKKAPMALWTSVSISRW